MGSTDVQGGGGGSRDNGSMKRRNQRLTCACDCRTLIVDNASRPPRELKLHIRPIYWLQKYGGSSSYNEVIIKKRVKNLLVVIRHKYVFLSGFLFFGGLTSTR